MANPMVSMSCPSLRFFLRSFCISATRKLQSDWPGESGCFRVTLNWGLIQNVAVVYGEKTGRWGFGGFAATDPPFPVPCCTWEVPAPAGRTSSPPLALIERRAPLLHLTRLERICREVTDLQPSELAEEITERHPDRERETRWPPEQCGRIMRLLMCSELLTGHL